MSTTFAMQKNAAPVGNPHKFSRFMLRAPQPGTFLAGVPKWGRFLAGTCSWLGRNTYRPRTHAGNTNTVEDYLLSSVIAAKSAAEAWKSFKLVSTETPQIEQSPNSKTSSVSSSTTRMNSPPTFPNSKPVGAIALAMHGDNKQ